MIDPHSGVPRWRQLAALLRARIESGDLRPGAAMPSETRLGQDYGVGRATVRRAVAELRAAGLVDVEHGYGTRVRGESDLTSVAVPRGSTLVGRMPTAAERAELDIPEGVPVLVVTVGGRERVYSADRTRLTFS